MSKDNCKPYFLKFKVIVDKIMQEKSAISEKLMYYDNTFADINVKKQEDITHINKNLQEQCDYLRNLLQKCECETRINKKNIANLKLDQDKTNNSNKNYRLDSKKMIDNLQMMDMFKKYQDLHGKREEIIKNLLDEQNKHRYDD